MMRQTIQKKLAIIGTVGLPAKYGGFETLADHLVRNLNEHYHLTVYCSGKKYPKNQRQKNYHGAQLKYLPLEANGVQSILYDALCILHALWYADVLLVLGVAGAWILPFVRLFTNKKIIVSIDGIEWKRDKWSTLAKWYLWWAEKIAVKYSHIDISDNESIQDYTAIRYGSLSRIIEYGANHVLHVAPTPADKQTYPFLKGAYAFKVCRIEPENNVHMVLEAFAELTKHTLVIVGNWNNSEYGKKLKARYEAYEHLVLLDPIYNQHTLDMLRGNALVYIHGHSAGGTNPSLVEAMYLGLPVLAFGVSYNKTTTEQKALYFKSATELKGLIEQVRVTHLKDLGKVMKEVAVRRYTWELIASRYQSLVEEALAIARKVPVQPKVSKVEEVDLMSLGAAHLKHPYLFFEKR